MTKGWRNESERHSLSARGIKTKPQKMLSPIFEAEGVVKDIVQFPEASIDYSDPEQVFTLFWVCSLNDDFSNFDFDEAFYYVKETIEDNLVLKGYGDFESYYEYWLKYHNTVEDFVDYILRSTVEYFPLAFDEAKERLWSKYPDVEEDDYEGILRSHVFDKYEKAHSQRTADDNFLRMDEIINEIESNPTDIGSKVRLMDKIIDLKHDRGFFWNVVNEGHVDMDMDASHMDVEALRTKVDRLYGRYN